MRPRWTAAALLFVACNGGDDEKLNETVKARLASEPTPLAQLDISTKDRIVTLTGVVATENERDRVVRIVRDVDRLLGVDNRLTIQRPVQVTGANDIAFEPNDRAIRNAIRRELDKEQITGVAIDVRDGVVRLYGDVPDGRRDEAVRLANDPSLGVKRVEDHLGELR